jgi:hypothetical protein
MDDETEAFEILTEVALEIQSISLVWKPAGTWMSTWLAHRVPDWRR